MLVFGALRDSAHLTSVSGSVFVYDITHLLLEAKQSFPHWALLDLALRFRLDEKCKLTGVVCVCVRAEYSCWKKRMEK